MRFHHRLSLLSSTSAQCVAKAPLMSMPCVLHTRRPLILRLPDQCQTSIDTGALRDITWLPGPLGFEWFQRARCPHSAENAKNLDQLALTTSARPGEAPLFLRTLSHRRLCFLSYAVARGVGRAARYHNATTSHSRRTVISATSTL